MSAASVRLGAAAPAAAARVHPLHDPERVWVEKNCYVDLWIELLQALGLEPNACLPFVLGVDFVDDQWTFFKPPLGDLRTLYGLDVQELTLWRPLVEHAVDHLGSGRLIGVEVDAYWLPDTAGTDYRRAHGKTTILISDIDLDARRLGYFHNAGRHELAGEDFAALFAPRGSASTDGVVELPPYAELVRIDRAVALDPRALRRASRRLLHEHFAWRPTSNPVERFRDRLRADLPVLQAAGLLHFHRWAFAGVRQLGAAFELAALHLRWLDGEQAPMGAVEAFESIATSSKALLLKVARAVHSGRTPELDPLLDAMSKAWAEGMTDLAGHMAPAPRPTPGPAVRDAAVTVSWPSPPTASRVRPSAARRA